MPSRGAEEADRWEAERSARGACRHPVDERAGSRGAESAMRAGRAPAASGSRRSAGHSRAGSDGPHGMERLTGRIGRRNDRTDRGPEIRRTRIAVTAFSQARWCPDIPPPWHAWPGRPTARRCRRAVRAALVDGDLRRSADAAGRPHGAVGVDWFAMPSVQRRFPGPPRSGTLPAAAEQAPLRLLMASRPATVLVTCARSCPCGSSCLR